MDRQRVGAEVTRPMAPERGFSLIETMMALSVLTVGVLGAAGVLATGMQKLSSSPSDVVATQKAQEAIEAVYSARDSHKLTWSQIRNVKGGSGSDNGIFVDGAKLLKLPGTDGLVNTADDSTQTETITLPGKDQALGTSDDVTLVLSGFTRDINIRDVADEPAGCGGSDNPCTLRKIIVTVTYKNGPTSYTYTLSSYISAYS